MNIFKKYLYTIPQNLFRRFRVFWSLFGVSGIYALWMSVVSKKNNEISLTINKYNHDISFRPASYDVEILRQIFVSQEYALPADIEPGRKFIIDAGAHCGFATIFFAHKYPDAHIISIEPNPDNFKLLEKNTYNLSNVKIMNSALLGESKSISANSSHNSFASFYVKEESGSGIESVTVFDLLNESQFDQIDILKVDIEGAEKEVFEKSENWIDDVTIIFVEPHDEYTSGCTSAILNVAEKRNISINEKGENIILNNKQ